MPAKADLRAVGADEKPHDRKPKTMTVTQAARDGTRLDELRAIRRVLARHMDDEEVSGRDLAALSNRYMAVSKEIESLETQERERADLEEDAADGASDAEWRPEAI